MSAEEIKSQKFQDSVRTLADVLLTIADPTAVDLAMIDARMVSRTLGSALSTRNRRSLQLRFARALAKVVLAGVAHPPDFVKGDLQQLLCLLCEGYDFSSDRATISIDHNGFEIGRRLRHFSEDTVLLKALWTPDAPQELDLVAVKVLRKFVTDEMVDCATPAEFRDVVRVAMKLYGDVRQRNARFPLRVPAGKADDEGTFVLVVNGLRRKILLAVALLASTEEAYNRIAPRLGMHPWLRAFLPTWGDLGGLRQGHRSISEFLRVPATLDEPAVPAIQDEPGLAWVSNGPIHPSTCMLTPIFLTR